MKHLKTSEQITPDNKTYSNNYLIGYLIKNNYLPVNSSDEECIVFFNPRKSQYLKLPSSLKTFTVSQIKVLFTCEAMDLPPKGEWLRFKLYKYISK